MDYALTMTILSTLEEEITKKCRDYEEVNRNEEEDGKRNEEEDGKKELQ